ncbi:MAG: DciA family protein [Phycisphaerales bacterium]|nr:DciA family protein [Phycisphaerales bacterium]
MPEQPTNLTSVAQIHTAQRIESLRRWRVRPPRHTDAGSIVSKIADQARRAQREVGGFAEAWQACVDPEIARQVSIASFRGGVATLATRNASLRWVIDRELRGGLLAQLRQACPVAITAVRVKSG